MTLRRYIGHSKGFVDICVCLCCGQRVVSGWPCVCVCVCVFSAARSHPVDHALSGRQRAAAAAAAAGRWRRQLADEEDQTPATWRRRMNVMWMMMMMFRYVRLFSGCSTQICVSAEADSAAAALLWHYWVVSWCSTPAVLYHSTASFLPQRRRQLIVICARFCICFFSTPPLYRLFCFLTLHSCSDIQLDYLTCFKLIVFWGSVSS